MERVAATQLLLFGKEAVHGVVQACDHRAMGFKLNLTPQGEFKSWGEQGAKLDTDHMLIREWSTAPLTGKPNYDEMGFPLSSVLAIPVSNVPGGTAPNTHSFVFDNRYYQDLNSFTFEYGTPDTRAHRVVYAYFDGLATNFSRTDAEMSGNIMAQKFIDGATMSTGNAPVWTFTFTNGPTGGGFRVGFKGAIATADVAYNAVLATMGAALQTALNALPTIGAGGVVVTVDGATLVVTGSGASLLGKFQPNIRIIHNGLTGGAGALVTSAVTTQGAFTELPALPILPSHISVYLAPTFATLAANKLTRARVANWAVAARASSYWVMDDANSGYVASVEDRPTIKFMLELQANSNGMALLTNARTGGGFFMRLIANNQNVLLQDGTSHPQFIIDAYCKISGFGEVKEDDKVIQVNWEISVTEDKTGEWGSSCIATLINDVLGY